MKGRVFDVRGALAIDAFSITMREMKDLIIRTYKNGRDVKRLLDGMKRVALPKPNPDIGG